MTTATLPSTGERFRCDECGMEIEVTNACKCTDGEPQFNCCGQPLKSLGPSFVSETKEAFVEQMHASLDKTKEVIAGLKSKASQASDATREELKREADLLTQQYDKLRGSVNDVKDASGDAWQDVASGCAQSWQRIKAASEKALSRYK